MVGGMDLLTAAPTLHLKCYRQTANRCEWENLSDRLLSDTMLSDYASVPFTSACRRVGILRDVLLLRHWSEEGQSSMLCIRSQVSPGKKNLPVSGVLFCSWTYKYHSVNDQTAVSEHSHISKILAGTFKCVVYDGHVCFICIQRCLSCKTWNESDIVIYKCFYWWLQHFWHSWLTYFLAET